VLCSFCFLHPSAWRGRVSAREERSERERVSRAPSQMQSHQDWGLSNTQSPAPWRNRARAPTHALSLYLFLPPDTNMHQVIVTVIILNYSFSRIFLARVWNLIYACMCRFYRKEVEKLLCQQSYREPVKYGPWVTFPITHGNDIFWKPKLLKWILLLFLFSYLNCFFYPRLFLEIW
jgi:hypothetical protein